MITALLVMTLVSAMLVGFTTVVMSDQKLRFIDRDRGQAFYAATGGLEKLTYDLGRLYYQNISPTNAQITALTGTAPVIDGVTFSASNVPAALPASQLSTFYCSGSGKTVTTVGGNGYAITFCRDTSGNPTTTANSPIRTGPNAGLIALQTPFQLDVTARTRYGGDAHLVRTIEAVAIPVFQFGMFSDMDLSFFAGPNFGFGGRVHTNGDLFLAQGNGATLTLSDRVSAVGEVVRMRLQNDVTIATSPHLGTVSMATGPTGSRSLASTEGSVVDGVNPRPTAPFNDPTWWNLSVGTYNSWIRNGRTGANRLELPLITAGGSNPALVQRPLPTEDVTNPNLLNERLFAKASIRILLSDTPADITNLPTVTSTAPVFLDGDWLIPAQTPVGYGPSAAARPPIVTTVGLKTGVISSGGANSAATPRLQNAAQVQGFLPPMRLNGQTVTCATKTNATRFSNCTVPVTQAFPVNTLLTAPGVQTTTSAGINATANVAFTMDVASTANFRPRPLWIGPTFVNCTGWNSDTFSGCTGLGAAPANNTAVTNNAMSNTGTGLIGGYLKIEMQDNLGVWTDITTQILNWGIGGPNLLGRFCNNPSPNAIVRFQRLRDNTEAAGAGGCSYDADATGARDQANWWPNVLFDTREGLQRDINSGATTLPLGGLMHYITLDVDNLSQWFTAAGAFAGSPGVNAMKENGGFTVYFSDRRNNRTDATFVLGPNLETGEYGWEDFVNPTMNATSTSNNAILDLGEDLNANGILDTYGMIPSYNGVSGALPPGWPLTVAATRPWAMVTREQAMTNRAVLFRRALKLTNGNNIRGRGVTGLTIVSENPVYVHGDWNAQGGVFSSAPNSHAATAVIADAVTLLSDSWADLDTLISPYAMPTGAPNANIRQRDTGGSWYRLAIIGGKGRPFLRPDASTPTDFGTDGGAHNFLRFLEGNGGTVNYRGSLATFFYNRQAVGTYKCCNTVYGAPQRNYNFDTDFLDPALLPPNTPKFRDLNAVGFSQEIRPGK